MVGDLSSNLGRFSEVATRPDDDPDAWACEAQEISLFSRKIQEEEDGKEGGIQGGFFYPQEAMTLAGPLRHRLVCLMC